MIPTWTEMEQKLTAELQRLREKNDSHSDELTTASRRGQIRLIKKMLKPEWFTSDTEIE